MKQHWFVFPIDVERDAKAPHVMTVFPDGAGGAPAEANAGQEAEPNIEAFLQQPAFVEPARGGARGRGLRAARETDNFGNPIGTEYGFKLSSNTRKHMDVGFTSRDVAIAYAEKLASEKPGTQYGVFECIGVFESTANPVVRKTFTASGELVPATTGES